VEDIDIYFELIESWAQRSIGEQADWNDPIGFLIRYIQNRHAEVSAAVTCQEELLTEEDKSFARPFIEEGFLRGQSESRIAALLTMTREMQQRRQSIELSRTLARYKPDSDTLVLSNPGIEAELSKHREMVSVSLLCQIDRSGMFTFKALGSKQADSRVKMTSLLNPELVNFVLKNSSSDAKVEVRLDPDYPSSSADPPLATDTPELSPLFLQLLKHVAFKRFLRVKTWATHQPQTIKDDPEAALQYFSRGLRSLEVFGSRSGDRAEIYIEELVDTSTVRRDPHGELTVASGGTIVGRMIHCDTTAADDTPCNDVELCHLDLAINVYEGRLGQERLVTPMTSRVTTADRIHLFKSAPIALNLLPGIAWLFFARSPRQLGQLFRELLA